MKLVELLEKGQIGMEDLCELRELARKKELAEEGTKACQKNICFTMNSPTVNCYKHIDPVSGESVEGNCNINGTITFEAQPKGKSKCELGSVNLLNAKEVLIAMCRMTSLANHLERFLNEQSRK